MHRRVYPPTRSGIPFVRLLSYPFALFAALLLAVTVLPTGAHAAAEARPSGVPNGAVAAHVWGWIDGDTFLARFPGATLTVRLAGVDAPEAPHGDAGECHGAESATHLHTRLPKKATVWLALDDASPDHDADGASLRLVWLLRSGDRHARSINTGTILVGDGAIVPEQVSGAALSALDDAEEYASALGRGIWASCGGAHAEIPAEAAPTPAQETEPAPTPAPVDASTFVGDDGCTYRNVDGAQVSCPVQADAAPAGATAKCNDGTWSFSQHRQGSCSHHGGVAYWL